MTKKNAFRDYGKSLIALKGGYPIYCWIVYDMWDCPIYHKLGDQNANDIRDFSKFYSWSVPNGWPMQELNKQGLLCEII